MSVDIIARGLATAALPKTGGTLTGNLLFSADNTYDIGASGATRPRSIYTASDVFIGGRALPGGGARGGFGASADGVFHFSNGAFSKVVVVGVGDGSPEGVITAGIGSVWHRTNGGAGTSLYVKESGAGNTGWVAK